MGLTLYCAPGSCSVAAQIALEETAVDFDLVCLDLAAAEQRKPAFLAVNPRGRVPALVADGTAITENIAILTYVAHRFPEAELLPFADLKLLARAFELMSWFASGVHVSFAQIFRSERFADDEATKRHLKSDGRQRVLLAYTELEALARAGEWMLGRSYSVVDPYALAFWRWGSRLDIDMHDYPAWTAHARRVLERPAAQRALARESAASARPQPKLATSVA